MKSQENMHTHASTGGELGERHGGFNRPLEREPAVLILYQLSYWENGIVPLIRASARTCKHERSKCYQRLKI